ncbi:MULTISPECIES: hypothetical protein [unclassified Halorubrum]|uniref:hypothetical protein n=1 Tax=unclassified Halorubrum TaxID=2642239 RepID=UPI0010F65DDC|nr:MULTISPECIES: hypothetical protein [unclassified Halorubrum]TKX45253.1 hypothetical protein EXE50_04650 [Halorubrum sp. ARQ200]TKX51573.1 hypothetical protein EXE49_01395 [Halorubrum sp. ASP121]
MSQGGDASTRARAATAVALLLLLAGCGGVVPGGAAPPDASPPDSPPIDSEPNETADERLVDVPFPAGFSRTGIDIATARERSVTFLRTEPVTGAAVERFRAGAYADYEYDATSERTRFRLDVHNGYVDVTRSEVYVDGGVRYSRSARNRDVSFEASNGSLAETRYRAADSMWAVASRILTVADFRAVRTVDEDGERLIRYAPTDVAVRNATDIRGYLTVDRNGVVREAVLAYDRAGESKRFEYAVAPRSADSEVAPPAWLPAARADA